MVIREYPKEIQKLMDVYEPYVHQLYHNETKNIPKEAIEAYEKVKKWIWEQGQ